MTKQQQDHLDLLENILVNTLSGLVAAIIVGKRNQVMDVAREFDEALGELKTSRLALEKERTGIILNG